MIGKQHAHSEGTRDRGRRLAERPLADDSHRRVREITNWVIEKAKLIDALPASVFDVAPVREQIAAQREYEREDVLGPSLRRVIADVANGDAVAPAIIDVHHIVAGGRHRNKFQAWKSGE